MKRSDHFVEFFTLSLNNLLTLLKTARNPKVAISTRFESIQVSRKILDTILEDVQKGDLPELNAEMCKKLTHLFGYARQQLEEAQQVETTEDQRSLNFQRCEILYRKLHKGFAGILKTSKRKDPPTDVH